MSTELEKLREENDALRATIESNERQLLTLRAVQRALDDAREDRMQVSAKCEELTVRLTIAQSERCAAEQALIAANSIVLSLQKENERLQGLLTTQEQVVVVQAELHKAARNQQANEVAARIRLLREERVAAKQEVKRDKGNNEQSEKTSK